MIEYIQGRVADLNPAEAVIETAAGVAYLLNISLPTYTELQGRAEAKLYVHEVVREDAWTLYGFATRRERAMLRQLIAVSGVGANTARTILSSIPAPELEAVIVGGDHARLKNIKGIGAKTAQRIIVELRDKIKPQDDTLIIQQPAAVATSSEEALAALITLGYQRAAAQKALRKIYEADPAIRVDAAVRKALAML